MVSSTASDVKQIGLIGYPVSHSLSPAMQNAAFDALGLPFRYVLLPIAPGDFEDGLRRSLQEGFAGFNVTVPHKERILPCLDTKSAEVEATGACNTVRVKDGKLHGFNTDIAGFLGGLREAEGIEEGTRAVILGAGGAARAVAYALASEGHDVAILSRRPEQAASIACALQPSVPARLDHALLDTCVLENALQGASLLVNCTPAGQYPHIGETPLPGNTQLPEGILVYDLVYNPRPTRLLITAAARGCRTRDGLSMLLHQGAAAFQIWTGKQAPLGVMQEALEREEIERDT